MHLSIELDNEWVRSVKKRYEIVFNLGQPDRVPGCAHNILTTEFGLGRGDLKEYFFCAERQLEFQLQEIAECQRLKADVVPFVIPEADQGVYASAFGGKVAFSSNRFPWVVEHPIKDIQQVKGLEVPDIRKAGYGPHILQVLEYFMEQVGDEIRVGPFGHQGPFSVAYELRGPSIFTDMYDHPNLVKQLLDLCCELLIEWAKEQSKITGRPIQSPAGFIDKLWLPPGKGGYYLVEMESQMLSPELYEEFVFPVNKRLLEAFGGGAIHTDGDAAHLLDFYLKLPVSLVRFYGGAIDLELVRQKLKGKVVLYGVKTAALGGAIATRKELVESIRMFAPGGGYVLGPDAYLPEVIEVVRKYGKYPLEE